MASRRQYQWQLNDGQQWMSINNDHVIEAHYCQPGAKGITIFTSDYGRIFIDFDKMEVQGCQLYIRRQTFLAHDEMQEMGWYYNDNRRWYEYGSQGSSSSKASVSSSDLERQYTTPQRNIRFTVGNLSYSLDIQAMAQTNLTTGVPRRVRRRPKLNSIIKINSPASSFQLPLNQQSASHIEGGWKWQFQADEGVWTDYNSPSCSVDSDEIERCYQRNPQGQVKFKSKRFSYTLNFTGMFQTNSSTGTQRSVRREQAEVQPTDQSPASSFQLPLNQQSASHIEGGWKWQFQADEGVWTDYNSPSCSVDSDEIERCYQRNPQGQVKFKSKRFSYTLNFTGMFQTNSSTGTQRSVRREQAEVQPTDQSPASSFQLPLNQQSASHIEGGWKWQFQADEGVWTDYNSPSCSVDSDEIERCYQRNPQGQVKFKSKRFSYTLNFTGMFQTNSSTGTQRSVRREQAEVQPTDQRVAFSPLHHPATPQAVTLPLPSSAGYTWEFMGDEGMWTEYQTPSCSIDGMEIERIFQLNSQGQTKFTAGRYIYTLDFPGMHQTNDILGTQRVVRRLLKNSPQLNSSDSAGTQCRWQYKDVDGAWRDFVKGSCNVSSQDIENSYQQNPSGTMSFGTNHFQYELDFSAMTQTNQSTRTVRKVRRHQE
ncbi:hypothetical protein SKAU_G00027310 [Synaphobranchus kaupii]|uniref:WWE domain-containing protein n=1 Tax=Synaphobranchus kaupii TaxID=118154 RepID=A0A9Q1GDZ5_SYNKA|nr:hypothetical protein SKAU_G00027310 [Synaphobranchus kaupii]